MRIFSKSRTQQHTTGRVYDTHDKKNYAAEYRLNFMCYALHKSNIIYSTLKLHIFC